MTNAEKIYDDFLYDCHIANRRLTPEDWAYYGKEEHHIEIPNRDGGLLTPLNSQYLTTYQHWIAGVLQSEVLQKCCFAYIPGSSLPANIETLRLKWNPMAGKRWWNNPETGEHAARPECPGENWVPGMSDEYKQQMSEKLSGQNNPRYGVTIPDEQKEKQRAKVTGRKYPEHSKRMTGEQNPMYGKSGELSPTYGLRGEKSPRYGKKQWVNAKGEKKFSAECPGPEWQNGLRWK